MGILRRIKQGHDEPVDPEARSPQLGLKHKDLAVMAQLVDHGANFDEPRHVIHFLYFDSKDAAAAAAAGLAPQGWTAEVRDPLPDYPEQWSLVREQHDVVLHRTSSGRAPTCSRRWRRDTAASTMAGKRRCRSLRPRRHPCLPLHGLRDAQAPV
jgi:hypothetical protein